MLADVGRDGLTIERVAEVAGVSRVTAWRRGGSRARLVDALLADLATDYRNTLWPVLTAPGSGRERLEAALGSLCDVIDRHLPLVLAADTAFHTDPIAGPAVRYTEPLQRLILDGVGDGTLRCAGSAEETALVLFNAVCWPYAHLRARHDWPPERARGGLIRLTLGQLLTPGPADVPREHGGGGT